MIRETLRSMSLRPGFRWGVFFAGLGVYGLLVLMGWYAIGIMWAMILFGTDMTMERENAVLGTPIGFLLPGYHESLRVTVFSGAVREGILFSLVLFSFDWFIHFDLHDTSPLGSAGFNSSLLRIPLDVAGGYVAGMAICLIVACFALVLSEAWWSATIPLGPMGIFMGTSMVSHDHPLIVWSILIPLCVCICGYFWFHLGDLDWVRCRHRRFITLWMTGDRHRPSRTIISSSVEDSLQRWMQRHTFTGTGQYLRGGFFRAFGPIILHWRGMLLAMVAGVLILGYAGRMVTDLAFMMLGVLVLWPVDLWAPSDILLPEGRREKRLMVFAMTLGMSLTCLAVGAATIGLSWLLNLFLPDFAFGRLKLDYTVIHPTGIYLACLLTPWVIVHRFLYPRAPGIVNVGAWVLFGGLAFGLMFIPYGKPFGWPWLADWVRALLIPALVIGWATLLLILSTSSAHDFALLRVRTSR